MTNVLPAPIPDIIFLDIHTSGFYQRGESMLSNLQPWAPYIGAMQCNSSGRIVNHFSCYVRSEGRMVKPGALDHHGIDHKATMRLGVREPRALGLLTELLRVGNTERMRIVTFGGMDVMVISSLLAKFAVSIGKQPSEYDRIWLHRPNTEFIDLQKPFAQQICKIESDIEDSSDYKWPSFAEAIKGVINRELTDSRDTFATIMALKDMYFEMDRLGMFPSRTVPAEIEA